MSTTPVADEAFVAVFGSSERRLLAYCRAILRDEQDARDALQNAAIRALTGMRAAQVRHDERAWLFRIARNEALSLLRARRPAAPLPDGLPTPAPDPEDVALRREELRQTLADIAALSEHGREALLLREVGGLSYAEVAAVLDSTPGAARQAVVEARRALRADSAARESDCATVRAVLAQADGRRRRSRHARAHLRACSACRAWSATHRPPTRRLWLLPSALAVRLPAWLGGLDGSAVAPGGSVALRARGLGALAALAAGAVGVGAAGQAGLDHDGTAARGGGDARATGSTGAAPGGARRLAGVATRPGARVRASGPAPGRAVPVSLPTRAASRVHRADARAADATTSERSGGSAGAAAAGVRVAAPEPSTAADRARNGGEGGGGDHDAAAPTGPARDTSTARGAGEATPSAGLAGPNRAPSGAGSGEAHGGTDPGGTTDTRPRAAAPMLRPGGEPRPDDGPGAFPPARS